MHHPGTRDWTLYTTCKYETTHLFEKILNELSTMYVSFSSIASDI